MAITAQSETSVYSTTLYKYNNPRDVELSELILNLETNYMPFMRHGARSQLQVVIDQMKSFQAFTNYRKKLHVSMSTERVSHNPAITVRAQILDKDVVTSSKGCIFVRYNLMPKLPTSTVNEPGAPRPRV